MPIEVGDTELVYVPDGEMRMHPTAVMHGSTEQDWAAHADQLDGDGRLPLSVGGLLIRTGRQTSSAMPTPPPWSCAGPACSDHAVVSELPWYADLREKWRPNVARVLLVGESAPDPGAAERRFFYAPTLDRRDNLFRGVMAAFYEVIPRGMTGTPKAPWLERRVPTACSSSTSCRSRSTSC